MGRRLLCFRLLRSLTMAATLVFRGGVLAPPLGMAQAVPVVWCHVRWEAVGMVGLPKVVVACLVGLVACRLVELVVQGSPWV